MQFKHDKTGSFIERPPSKTNAMIQQLLDQQGQLLDQQQALYELLAAGSEGSNGSNEPIGVFSGGNGNDNQGNNHQGNSNVNPGNNHQGNSQGNESGNVDQGEEREYHCNGCGSVIPRKKARCPSCDRRMNWDGVAVN
jgi:hypothetical protein